MPPQSTPPATTAVLAAEESRVFEAGWIGAGGAIGALARSLLAWHLPSFGWHGLTATQLVNLLGAMALGVLLGVLESRGPHPRWRAFLGVGVLGSFTTFATLVDESRSLAATTSPRVALAFLAGSLAVGIAGFWIGERAVGLGSPWASRSNGATEIPS